jgi:hypothetical protein
LTAGLNLKSSVFHDALDQLTVKIQRFPIFLELFHPARLLWTTEDHTMKPIDRTPSMRALALAVTLAGAVTASLLVTQASLATSAGLAGYGVDDHAAASAEGYGR